MKAYVTRRLVPRLAILTGMGLVAPLAVMGLNRTLDHRPKTAELWYIAHPVPVPRPVPTYTFDFAVPLDGLDAATQAADLTLKSGNSGVRFEVLRLDTKQGSEHFTGGSPTDVTLLMDQSASIMSSDTNNLRIPAAATLVRVLAGGVEIGLSTFGSHDGADTIAPQGTAPDAVISEIERLPTTVGGGTPIFSALTQSSETLGTRARKERVIVCFTDGSPGDPNLADSALEAARRNRVKVYFVALGNFGPDVRDTYANFASATGGTFFDAPDPQRLSAAFAQVSRALRVTGPLTHLATIRATRSHLPLQGANLNVEIRANQARWPGAKAAITVPRQGARR